MSQMTPRDRPGTGQAHRRTGRSQARRCDRAQESLAPRPGGRAAAQRDNAQEHSDDRPDRRRQDGNLDAALAQLAKAPFIKVEATKFTEVGYVGREVDSIIRDLMDVAIKMTREDAMSGSGIARGCGGESACWTHCCHRPRRAWGSAPDSEPAAPDSDTRQKFRKMLREGKLDDREIEIEVKAIPIGIEIMAPPGMEEMTSQLQGMFQNLGGNRRRTRKLKIKDALSS